jgi:hypothetical protein
MHMYDRTVLKRSVTLHNSHIWASMMNILTQVVPFYLQPLTQGRKSSLINSEISLKILITRVKSCGDQTFDSDPAI